MLRRYLQETGGGMEMYRDLGGCGWEQVLPTLEYFIMYTPHWFYLFG